MNTYRVFAKGMSTEPMGFVFVKDGFNFSAAFFNLLWSFYHRLWRIGFVTMLFLLVISILTNMTLINEVMSRFFICIFITFLGIYANNFYYNSLISRGYNLCDIVCASSLNKAKQRFFDKNFGSF